MTKLKPLKFKYHNNRGVISERTVTPECLEFIGDPNFDYQPGWFLSGYDHDKKARRSFRLSHIFVNLEDHQDFELTLEVDE